MASRTPERYERQNIFPATAFRALFMAAALCFGTTRGPAAAAETPKIGQQAPDFQLRTPLGEPVQLSNRIGDSTVVLVVLRGYPGYQCPYCQKQVHSFIEHAAEFARKNASVILVYPGPPASLISRGTHRYDHRSGKGRSNRQTI